MTLKELSKRLGLSQTTVSRALNGYPEVSEATREKVAQAARTYGYTPNTRARALATGRAMTIAHVIQVSTQYEMVNPIFADFTAGASEVYARNGYDMLLSVVPDADEHSVYRNFASKRNIDGLIIHAPRRNDPRIPFLNDLGLPYVVHGRSSDATTPYAWVDVNNTRAFQRATDLLLDLGHRRIALLNGLEHLDFALRRRAGYTQALTARGLSPDPTLMSASEMTEALGYDRTRHVLTQPNPPTALLISSMIMAIGARRALDDLHLKMGRDVSLITYDDDLSYFRSGADIPAYTVTRSSVRKAGQCASQLLIDMIEGKICPPHRTTPPRANAAPPPSAPPTQILLEAEVMLGQSTGPATPLAP